MQTFSLLLIKALLKKKTTWFEFVIFSGRTLFLLIIVLKGHRS